MGNIEPAFIAEEDIKEISEYLGRSNDYCRDAILNYDPGQHAELWHKMAPKTEKELFEFYSTTDHYIFELTRSNASKERHAFHGRVIESLMGKYTSETHKKVLDYGSGVAADAIKFGSRGYQVTIADIPGKTSDFARYRLKRRNIPHEFIPITQEFPIIGEKYDIILCFDVLEHVMSPVTTLKHLVRHLKGDGVMAIINCPDDGGGTHPCHLQHTFLDLGKLWPLTLDNVGLVPVDNCNHLYRKPSFSKKTRIKLRYLFWRATSLYVTRISKVGHQS